MTSLDELWDRLPQTDKDLLVSLATGARRHVAAEDWYYEAGWEGPATARNHLVKLVKAGFLRNVMGHRMGIVDEAARDAVLAGAKRDAESGSSQSKKGGGRLPLDVESVLERVIGLEGRVTAEAEVALLIVDARACLKARGRYVPSPNR